MARTVKAPAGKTTTKKTISKKVASKKTASKKTVTKSKKAVPGKAAAKKIVTKKSEPKKAVAKKTVSKRLLSDKAAADTSSFVYRGRNKVTDPFGDDQKLMKEALKQRTVPVLRELGFEGSFPKFRRIAADRHAVLWFAWARSGTSVTIDMATVPSRKDASLSEDYKRAVSQTPESQTRAGIQAKSKFSPGLYYFNFDDPAFGPHRHEELADLLSQLIRTKGEAWMRSPARRKRR